MDAIAAASARPCQRGDVNVVAKIFCMGTGRVQGGIDRGGTRCLVRLGLLLALVAITSCLVTVAQAAAQTFPVKETTVQFVDTSRPTMPNGSFPGSPSRALSTLIIYPERNAHDHHRYPLIEFSPGFTAVGPAYAPVLRKWAAEGYVIAVPTFPLSSAVSPGGPNIFDYVNQPGDVSFLISQMLAQNKDPSSPLFHNIDTKDIGVAGHSLGAITTLGVAYNSCCQDPRIDAAVPISGIELPFPGGSYFTGPAVPLLLIHGTADGTVPYGASVGAYAQADAPKFFLTLTGAPHVPFFGPWAPVIDNTVIAFFNAYLGHDSVDRIAEAGSVDGVSTFQQALP
jgi:dienelactone hydrolase